MPVRWDVIDRKVVRLNVCSYYYWSLQDRCIAWMDTGEEGPMSRLELKRSMSLLYEILLSGLNVHRCIVRYLKLLLCKQWPREEKNRLENFPTSLMDLRDIWLNLTVFIELKEENVHLMNTCQTIETERENTSDFPDGNRYEGKQCKSSYL